MLILILILKTLRRDNSQIMASRTRNTFTCRRLHSTTLLTGCRQCSRHSLRIPLNPFHLPNLSTKPSGICTTPRTPDSLLKARKKVINPVTSPVAVTTTTHNARKTANAKRPGISVGKGRKTFTETTKTTKAAIKKRTTHSWRLRDGQIATLRRLTTLLTCTRLSL